MFNLQNISITRSQANYGGVFKIDSCFNLNLKDLEISNILSKKQAGVFSIENANVRIESVSALNISAFSGTFIEINHPDSEIYLKDVMAEGLYAASEGAFLLSSTIKSFKGINIFVKYSSLS